MKFNPEFIDRVRDANNIVDFISDYTTLKKTSSGFMGRCPLPGHNEKSPSFSVSDIKQVYHCFGCQKQGNIFHAVQELKGLSFPEAVEYLASRANIALPEKTHLSSHRIEAKNSKEALLKINKLTADFYHEQFKKLSETHPAKQYCAKRGLTSELIDLFKIGYASEEWDGLEAYLKKIKAPLPLAEKLGLLKTRKSGAGQYDLFRSRIIFPIQNVKEEFLGFGGRVINPEDQPKYLNSPESEVFSKGKVFYGLFQALRTIRSDNFVIVVEGYMDYLALYGAGIKNVVATLGTALTESHAHVLSRYTHNVVVLFDGDQAGQRAAERSLPILLAQGLRVRGLTLPDALDPDDFIIKFGAEELRSRIKRSAEMFILYLERVTKSYSGTAAEKISIIEQVGELFASIKDRRLYDLYLTELARRLSVDPQWVAKNLPNPAQKRKFRPLVTTPSTENVISKDAKINLKGAPKSELFLLNLCLLKEDFFNLVMNSGFVSRIAHPGVRQIFNRIEEIHRQNTSLFAKLTTHLMTQVESPGDIGLHLGEPFVSMGEDALAKMFTDCQKQIEERWAKDQTRTLAAQMRFESPEDQIKKLQEIVNIRKKLNDKKYEPEKEK